MTIFDGIGGGPWMWDPARHVHDDSYVSRRWSSGFQLALLYLEVSDMDLYSVINLIIGMLTRV